MSSTGSASSKLGSLQRPLSNGSESSCSTATRMRALFDVPARSSLASEPVVELGIDHDLDSPHPCHGYTLSVESV